MLKFDFVVLFSIEENNNNRKIEYIHMVEYNLKKNNNKIKDKISYLN